MFRSNLWTYMLWGNPILSYLSALIIFVAFLLISEVFRHYLLLREKFSDSENSHEKEYHVKLLKSIKQISYVLTGFYLATLALTLPDLINKAIFAIFILVIFYQVSVALGLTITHTTELKVKREEVKKSARFITGLLNISLGIFVILFLLSNLGFNITSLIAGLGIGGVTVALALQSILADLFSSFAIYLDKPFEVGDVVMVGEDLGVVKKIGIKTTRISTLQGDELIISNKDVTSDRIHNLKRMETRRAVISFGIRYDTSVDVIREIPIMIKGIIEKIDGVSLNRTHFSAFGPYALMFDTVYYINSPDYIVYMDKNQEILLKIKEELDNRHIAIEVPATHVYGENLGNRS